ncbi:Glycoside hydrolase, 38 vacuolar alpha mannosidase [Steccherinum ochraceum]|uniref:Alpha-mannosidase n=1 Tax=Steccherinum ochraceum TaxID=92696 RepID=A0A4R0RJ84_9APHY|nr:Glycoside hydrolase, 38 vacuolar alpha mannosidase [Steccherinum ochraceum]
MASSHLPHYDDQNYGTGAKWIKHLTKNRLDTFTGGHFADVNLSSVLFTHRLSDDQHVRLEVWSAPGLTKPSFEEAMKQKFKPAKKGDSFGPSFEFDPGCEAMIFGTDGTPLQGITGGYGGDRRVEYIIPREAVKAGKHSFIIESSCNGMFGVPWNGDTIAPPDMNRYFNLDSADLVVPNQEAWGLLADFTTLKEIGNTLPGNGSLQNKAITVANAIMNEFDETDKTSIARARKIAEQVFGKGWEQKAEGIYEEGAKRAQIWGIGYCHIDTAWLWPYSVTQQKVARSWSTQIDLMERYPEHRFTCSQAQQFKWLEQLYPKLFDRVREKVKTGQFHLVGGSWVENDANMPSGEALARQFLYGQRYFESRFGKRCETAWLPDSFGLTGALPQLIRLADMKYFFTQKLSWNNINVFPHSTFNWVGIDGSQVLSHMTPVDTYTAQASVGDIHKGITNHKNLESSDTALLVFGNGDGGGGPLAKMLENLRRIRATSNESRELPSVDMGHSVEEFFDSLLSESEGGHKLPNWNGELYLEFHRGTYTSHGSIKKGNRKSEILLRDVEHLATLASLYKHHNFNYVYPKSKIDDCWEKVLLNQFHDVLPGSAIGMVYKDAEQLYSEVSKDGEKLIEEALSALFPAALDITDPSIKSTPGHIIGYNTTFFPRRDVVALPLTGAASRLKSQVVQTSKDGSVGYALMDAAGGEGARVSKSRGLFADSMPVSVFSNGSDHFVLRNSSVQLTIYKGRITSVLDVQLDRELIAKGQTGGLVIFEDRPNYWDAWDVEIHHLETAHPLEFSNLEITAEGPLRASLKAETTYGKSKISVTISLDAIAATLKHGSRSLFNFDATVDWQEKHKFLKFELPLDIHSGVATYETPFGHVQRSTHKNTTWDMAKFEVCGHKFADLSEFGYGVAILSESKYGFSCRGNVLRISLLRAATAPDADQDMGKHEFSWAVMPHQGHFLESDVPAAAFLYNSPLHVRFASDESLAAPFMSASPPFTISGDHNVILETIKRGEDDDFKKNTNPTVVLRLYEAFGGHARVKLRVSPDFHVVKATITNLLEDELEVLGVKTDNDDLQSVKLDFRGFEVKTVKLTLGSKTREPKRESWVTVDA